MKTEPEPDYTHLTPREAAQETAPRAADIEAAIRRKAALAIQAGIDYQDRSKARDRVQIGPHTRQLVRDLEKEAEELENVKEEAASDER